MKNDWWFGISSVDGVLLTDQRLSASASDVPQSILLTAFWFFIWSFTCIDSQFWFPSFAWCSLWTMVFCKIFKFEETEVCSYFADYLATNLICFLIGEMPSSVAMQQILWWCCAMHFCTVALELSYSILGKQLVSFSLTLWPTREEHLHGSKEENWNLWSCKMHSGSNSNLYEPNHTRTNLDFQRLVTNGVHVMNKSLQED